MPLGNNRDYKTSARRAQKALLAHFTRMTELMKTGLSREEASGQAYRELRQKGKN